MTIQSVIYKKEHANPFNWVGSKHRYLREYLEVLTPLLDKRITVLDPFMGGGDLISKLPTHWDIHASDMMSQVYQLHVAIQEGLITTESVISGFNGRGMSKTNEDAYLTLRDEYNKNPSSQLLYLLMTNSFNNQLRFNQKGGFNMPFGKNRSSFNGSMQAKLKNYIQALKEREINFYNKSYCEFDFTAFDLIVLDPPYSNTCATYNESTGWNEDEDFRLFNKLDESGKDFVYFNQTWSKGVRNQTLINWMEGKQFKLLNETSNNCNHQRNNGFTEEVMVYKITA